MGYQCVTSSAGVLIRVVRCQCTLIHIVYLIKYNPVLQYSVIQSTAWLCHTISWNYGNVYNKDWNISRALGKGHWKIEHSNGAYMAFWVCPLPMWLSHSICFLCRKWYVWPYFVYLLKVYDKTYYIYHLFLLLFSDCIFVLFQLLYMILRFVLRQIPWHNRMSYYLLWQSALCLLCDIYRGHWVGRGRISCGESFSLPLFMEWTCAICNQFSDIILSSDDNEKTDDKPG